MKPRFFFIACLACLLSFQSYSQCLPVINDTAACTGTEALVADNEIISAGTTKWFYGSATYNSLRIQAGGKLIVCGQLQVNDFGLQGGTLVITRSGRMTANTGGGASMVFNGGTSIYNLGFFKLWCNLVLDGPDAWTNPVLPNIVWNGRGATIELSNTYFVLEKGNCFFVNNGTANFSGIINNTLSDNGSVCLGNMSRMYVSLLENRKPNTYVAPSGPACVFIRNWGFSYEPLTTWPSVFLCRSSTYCMDGCDSIARQNQKWGAAALFNSCSSCAGIYLLPINFTDLSLKEQSASMLISWSVDKVQEQGRFIIQRSRDGVSFENIDSVSGRSENALNAYWYADVSPLNGRSFYRVVWRHADDRLTTSGMLTTLRNDKAGEPKVFINPFKDDCVIVLPDALVQEVRVLTVTGSVLHKHRVGKHVNRIVIPAEIFKSAGTYVAQIITSEKIYTVQLVKQ